MDGDNKNKTIKQDFKILRRIYKFLGPFVGLLVLVFLLNILFSVLSALSLVTIKPLFQIIFKTEQTMPGAESTIDSDLLNQFYQWMENLVRVPGDMYSSLLNLGLFIIIVFVLKNLFKYFSAVYSVKLQEGVIKSIRDKVFSNLTSLSFDFFSKSKSGNLISIITNDVNVLNNNSISSLTIILRDSIQVLSFLFVLIAISGKLTLIAFSTTVISYVLIRIAMRFIRRYASRMQIAMADYTSTLQETISGMRVIKAYNAETNANDRFFNDTNRYVKSAVKHKKIMALVPSINEIFAILALCVVLFVGGYSVMNLSMKPEDLMQFLFILFAIMSPMAKVLNTISRYQRGIVAAQRVFSIIDEKPAVKSGPDIVSSFDNILQVKDMSFAYEEMPVLRDVSFELQKGKKIAFVGPSGSGKSTMLYLIVRFYDPTSGEILIDGKNIRDFTLESYRSLFGMVAQDTALFNDTVANNIAFSDKNVTMNEIIHAAKISNAYNFIMNLPDGFDTYIGDRGVLLSGGEQQRLSIARALVRNPQILIFDEATSSLDAESEKVVQEAINYSLKDRTAIIVAHRLATIIDSDEILVFDQGRIVERGTHAELLQNDGVYRKLYEIQFAEKELGEA